MAFAIPLVAAAGIGGSAAALGGSLATSLAVGSTALSGVSSFQQSMYQAAVAKQNAKIAAVNAARTSDAAQTDQQRSDLQYAQQEGAAEAAQSASGLDVLGASQVLARQNIDRVRGLQAVDIRKQGEAQVANFFQQQASYLGEARAAKTTAWMGLAATAFGIGAAGSKDPALVKNVNTLIGGAKSTLGI